jgi:hypothetical protein
MIETHRDSISPYASTHMDAATVGAARVETRHRGGNAAIVHENQVFRQR